MAQKSTNGAFLHGFRYNSSHTVFRPFCVSPGDFTINIGYSEDISFPAMPEPNESHKPTGRVILPPRRRTPISPTGVPKQPQSTVPPPSSAEAAPSAPSYKPPPSPPPGISSISGLQQGSSLPESPVSETGEAQEIQEPPSPTEKRFSASQLPIKLVPPESDSFSVEEPLKGLIPLEGAISPIAIYLALGASLVALGIQVWILLGATSAG